MTTVAVALLERGGKLLICRRRADQSHAGKWEFPGGKVEAGESPREAVVRELTEELDIRAAAVGEVLRYVYTYPSRPPVRLVFFSVPVHHGTINPAQFAEVRWESRIDLLRFDFLEGDARIVRELAEGLHRPPQEGIRSG